MQSTLCEKTQTITYCIGPFQYTMTAAEYHAMKRLAEARKAGVR